MIDLQTNDIVIINNKLYKYFLIIEGSWTIANVFVAEDLDTIKVKDLDFARFVRDNVKVVLKPVDDNPKTFEYIKPDSFTLDNFCDGLHVTFRDGMGGIFKNNKISRLQEFGLVEKESIKIYHDQCYDRQIRSKYTEYANYNYIFLSDYKNDLRHKTIKNYDIISIYNNNIELYARDGIDISKVIYTKNNYFKVIRKGDKEWNYTPMI